MSKGALQTFIQEHNPYILCLNETKIDNEKLDKTKLYSKLPNEYAQYWNCCKARKGYSGTAILTKARPVSVAYDFPGHD